MTDTDLQICEDRIGVSTMSPNLGRSNSNHTQDPHVRIVRQPERIYVGVDFGTSTTKVMYRPIELDRQTRLIDFAHGNENFPSHAMPSSIKLDNENRLWFGTAAEDGCGQVFRSFKVCVACHVGAVACRGCTGESLQNAKPSGCFSHGLLGFISAHELMIYYLAWLLNDFVVPQISNAFKDGFELDLRYNLGVPVPYLDAKPKLVDRFEWILYAALALRGKIHNDISAAQARSLLIEVLPHVLLPAHKDRHHCAISETAAAAMWLQKTVDDEGLTNYMLLDIGAGTTDITIYRYDKEGNPDFLPIFGAKSVPVAGDNIDFSTIEWFARKYSLRIENASQLSSTLLQEFRRRKEFLSNSDKPMKTILNGKVIPLDKQTYVRDIVNLHAEKIKISASEAFSDAYKHNPHEEHWPALKTVMLGGGSRIVGMQHYFEINKLRPNMNMEQPLINLGIPPNVEKKNVNDFQILAVAYGLAFPPAELPKIRLPNGIQPMQQAEPDDEPEYNANASLSN